MDDVYDALGTCTGYLLANGYAIEKGGIVNSDRDTGAGVVFQARGDSITLKGYPSKRYLTITSMLRLSDIYYDNISPEEDDHLEQTASTDEDYFREKQALADQRVDGLEGPEVDEAISDIKMAQSEVESAVDILRTRSEGVDAFDGFIIERRLYPYSGISLGEFSSEVRSFLTEYNRLRRPILNVNESVGLGLENPEELATASMDDGIDDRSLH